LAKVPPAPPGGPPRRHEVFDPCELLVAEPDNKSEPEVVVSGARQQGEGMPVRQLPAPQFRPPPPSVQPVYGTTGPDGPDPYNPRVPPGNPEWFQWNPDFEMWYCRLCWANADYSHLTSSKHQKRAEYPEYYMRQYGGGTGVQQPRALTDINPGTSVASGFSGAGPCGPPSCPPPLPTTISGSATTIPGPAPPSCPPPWAAEPQVPQSTAATDAPGLEASPPSRAPAPPPAGPCVPKDWRTIWDPDAERFYYWQPSTNLVQWDHPKAADLKLPVPEPQRQIRQQQPQQVPYMQPQPAYTMQSELPTPVPTPVPTPTPSVAPLLALSEMLRVPPSALAPPRAQQPLPVGSAPPRAKASPPQAPREPPPLPPGWRETRDQSQNGKPYYYFVKDGEILKNQWERPTGQ